MKIDLTETTPTVKTKILEILIPAFREKEIVEMTNLSASTIGYYRRNKQIPTYCAKKKQYRQEAEQELRDTLEHNKEYALQRAKELCADFGISDA